MVMISSHLFYISELVHCRSNFCTIKTPWAPKLDHFLTQWYKLHLFDIRQYCRPRNSLRELLWAKISYFSSPRDVFGAPKCEHAFHNNDPTTVHQNRCGSSLNDSASFSVLFIDMVKNFLSHIIFVALLRFTLHDKTIIRLGSLARV